MIYLEQLLGKLLSCQNKFNKTYLSKQQSLQLVGLIWNWLIHYHHLALVATQVLESM